MRFDTRAQADTAVSTLDGAVLPNLTHPLRVKFADADKVKRRGRNANQTQHPLMGNVRVSAAGLTMGVGGPATAIYRSNQLNLRYDPFARYAPTAIATIGTYQHQHTQQQPHCLFIYRLPPEADENLLYRLFGPFGAISSVKIIRELSTGNCKGYGFVNYVKLEDAQQAILALDGFPLDGTKCLQVSFKTPTNTL